MVSTPHNGQWNKITMGNPLFLLAPKARNCISSNLQALLYSGIEKMALSTPVCLSVFEGGRGGGREGGREERGGREGGSFR